MKLPLLPAVLVAAVGGVSPASAVTQRFAVVAGTNDGGGDRVRLQYANRDARAVAGVLEELGGVATEDRVVLLDVERAGLLAALEAIQPKLSAARSSGHRVELVFYYSGHSDEDGLLLGLERLGYRELRQALDAMPADVRIAIVDRYGFRAERSRPPSGSTSSRSR